MVEITYQMVLSTLQTVGLLVGIFYYVTTLRNAQKTRELALKNQELTLQSQELTRKAQEQALETRQAQLFMQIYRDMSSPENFIRTNELYEMEWEDYSDFEDKYGSENNPENYALRYSTWMRLNGVGLLVRDGLIDVGRVHDLISTMIFWQWEKFKDVIRKQRELYNLPKNFEGFEFLANEMVKEVERRGYSVYVPESFGRFVPKEKEDT
jgi:hypothetical protein